MFAKLQPGPNSVTHFASAPAIPPKLPLWVEDVLLQYFSCDGVPYHPDIERQQRNVLAKALL